MAESDEELTSEEMRQAERMLDERIRAASRERYRRMVEVNDPELYRGPVRLSPEEVSSLREEIRGELLLQRRVTAEKEQQGQRHEQKRRRLWQRRSS
jgi:hypothetical protein